MFSNHKKILCLIAAGLLCLAGCETLSDFSRTTANVLIRVAIAKNVDDIPLEVQGPYEIRNPVNNALLKEGRQLLYATVRSTEKGIQIGDEHFPYPKVRIYPSKDITLFAKGEGRRYRGVVDFVRTDKEKLVIVNWVDLEDYIRGVLYHEASHRWPLEALKVQAVASRTYAVYQMKVNARQPYDVTSDIYSQVYGGRSAERYRTNIAVQRTAGQIMMDRGKVLPTYFSSCCGGHTEDVSYLWNHKDILPLRGVRCNFCIDSPHYQWKKNYRLKDFQDLLNKHGHEIGTIQNIRVAKRNPSGRVVELEITDTDGKVLAISGKDFRSIVGANTLKSNRYRVDMKGYYCDLVGQGWGHGVGMCQWGAYGMARQRYSYDAILKYYYPGAQISDLAEAGVL